MFRVLGNEMLSRMFGSKREEVAGDRRKLYIEKLHVLLG
jgi:hypothetical protein